MLPTLHLQLSHRPQPSGQASIMTRLEGVNFPPLRCKKTEGKIWFRK